MAARICCGRVAGPAPTAPPATSAAPKVTDPLTIQPIAVQCVPHQSRPLSRENATSDSSVSCAPIKQWFQQMWGCMEVRDRLKWIERKTPSENARKSGALEGL